MILQGCMCMITGVRVASTYFVLVYFVDFCFMYFLTLNRIGDIHML